MAEFLYSSISAEGLQSVKEYKQETTVSGKGSIHEKSWSLIF